MKKVGTFIKIISYFFDFVHKKIESTVWGALAGSLLIYHFDQLAKHGLETGAVPVIGILGGFLDAGHGGFDGGASSIGGTLEKDINLSIALKTRDTLTLFGFNVIMTRSDDIALADTKKEDMYSRLNIAKNNPNSVFVSIHQNYFTEGKYSGAQMFYGSNNQDDAKSLALILQKNFKANLNPQNERQVKKADKSLFLFKKAPQPSVLIECGFLSNYNEAQLLQNEKYQTKIALTIAQSILEYYKSKDIERS